MRVAIGGLHTECSSYSPLWQQWSDFTRTEGAALLEMAGVNDSWQGITALPIFHDRAIPGGPVEPEVFARQRKEFLQRLQAAMPLDGVLLIMHGAYFVPGTDDPEGTFLTDIRNLVGPDAIISSAWDLHGQITDCIISQIDAFAAFRTAPHIDQPQTYERAARMLLDPLRGGPRPQVVRQPIPLLVSGEMSSTFAEPCHSLYASLSKYDNQPGILDANLMIGYVWADSPRATAAAVVTCTDARSGHIIAHQIADNYHAVRHQLLPDMESGPLPDMLARLDSPAILADSGDNPTAGGVGDRADVLAGLLSHGWANNSLTQEAHHVIIAGITAPQAVNAIRRGEAELTIGGLLGGGGPTLQLTPDQTRIIGEDAVVTLGNIVLVLTSRRRPFHKLDDFRALDLDIGKADLLVVKSGYLSPELRELPRRQLMVLTDGAVSQDLENLPNLHRPRPTWPFQKE
ncbi:MAG: M81 family metallopeptidase [Paracoccus sp. (in: a-proteobacteria)]